MTRVTLQNPIISVDSATERMMAIVHTSMKPGKQRHITAGTGALPVYDIEHTARIVEQGVRCVCNASHVDITACNRLLEPELVVAAKQTTSALLLLYCAMLHCHHLLLCTTNSAQRCVRV